MFWRFSYLDVWTQSRRNCWTDKFDTEMVNETDAADVSCFQVERKV